MSICKIFLLKITYNIKFDELSKFMKNLTIARNICAHDERFYDTKFNLIYYIILQFIKHPVLKIPYNASIR